MDSSSKEKIAVAEPQAPRRSKYMPQLDGLRATAALGVMLYHYYTFPLDIFYSFGNWRVRLFFVLSGFLITGILLKGRTSEELSEKVQFLKQFYMRRALRIFPLFYFVLFSVTILNVPYMREYFFWHLTYTTNILFSLHNAWLGLMAPMWSLAVEHQFYLFWPLLILFVPRKFLLAAIITVIVCAPLYRVTGVFLNWSDLTLRIITFSSMDCLGVGALLAWLRHRNPESFEKMVFHPAYRIAGAILALVILIPFFAYFLPIGFIEKIYGQVGYYRFDATMQALAFGWLVHCAAVGFRGRIAKGLLQNPVSLYIGKISYGIYVYHSFMPLLLVYLLGLVHLSLPGRASLNTLLQVALTIVVSTISWYCLEQPFLRLKNKKKNKESELPIPAANSISNRVSAEG